MNKFFYFEGNIYETEEQVIAATLNHNHKKYDTIETANNWDEFEAAFNTCKKQGNCDLDAIQWAKTNQKRDLSTQISKNKYLRRDFITNAIKDHMEILSGLRRNLEKEDNKFCQKYYGFCKGDVIKVKYHEKNYTGMVKDIELFTATDMYELFYIDIVLISKQNKNTFQNRALCVSEIEDFSLIEKGNIHKLILDGTVDIQDNYSNAKMLLDGYSLE